MSAEPVGVPMNELRTLRRSIDNIDAALIHMLAERFRCTKDVGVLKARHGLPPADPEREVQQIARLRELAEEVDLDPDFAEMFLGFVIRQVIRHHEALRRAPRALCDSDRDAASHPTPLASTVPYILGHSEAEHRRLMLQAAMLKPITRRLLLEAGLQPGMRVLDIGCGSGDVSLLLAEMVGPTGSVVGIDPNPVALALARDRARDAGHPGITFHEAIAENYADPAMFDLAIGRYVLMHQADPAVLIRAAASRVRMGGVVAFHEVGVFGTFEMRPSVPLWQQSLDLIREAFFSVLPHPDTAGRLIDHFQRAGLGQPTVLCEMLVAGGTDSAAYAWVAETLRSVMPQLQKIGVPTAGIGIDTLEDRLREAVIAAQGQGALPPQFCGWVRV